MFCRFLHKTGLSVSALSRPFCVLRLCESAHRQAVSMWKGTGRDIYIYILNRVLGLCYAICTVLMCEREHYNITFCWFLHKIGPSAMGGLQPFHAVWLCESAHSWAASLVFVWTCTKGWYPEQGSVWKAQVNKRLILYCGSAPAILPAPPCEITERWQCLASPFSARPTGPSVMAPDSHFALRNCMKVTQIATLSHGDLIGIRAVYTKVYIK